MSPATIKRILRRENLLRLAPETQAAFRAAAAARGGGAWLEVVEGLQRRVAAEFGLPSHVGLDAMRQAEALCPDHVAEVREISLYRKHNRCRDGSLRVGQPPPDAQLVRVSDGAAASVHGLLASASPAPLVLLVGSYS